MGRKGNDHNNAVIEFFHIVYKKWVYSKKYRTK